MMADKAEQLRSTLGATIRESAAGRRAAPTAGAPASRVPARDLGVDRDRDAREIATDQLVPDPDQPRRHFDPEALEVMAASLRSRGQLQPIRVRWGGDSLAKWVIISGERRYRGALLAGLDKVKAIITEAAGGDVLTDQLIENIVREDLDPIEEAEAFRKLMADEGLSQRQLADRLGISQGRVAQRVKLLELPEGVRARVEMGELAASSAYALTQAPEGLRERIAEEAVAGDLSRSEVQERVDRALRESPGRSPRAGKGRGGAKARASRASGLMTARKIRTDSKIRITAERAAPFDRPALRAALLEAVAVVSAEIDEDGPRPGGD